jgi:molybdopterin synthase catalytic subunit
MSISVRLFAMLREQLGTSEVVMELTAGETVEALFARLFDDETPRCAPGTILFAVNQRYVTAEHVLEDGDEVAFIPPLAGGAGDPRVALCSEPLQLAAMIAQVSSPQRGGVATFTGCVRDHFEGRAVLHLDYEAYPEMALCEMSRLCDEVEAKWDGVAIAMAHRVGRLAVGEAAVQIAVAGGHRAEVFAACRHAIDRLKETVPIFKKEVYEDGSTWKSS